MERGLKFVLLILRQRERVIVCTVNIELVRERDKVYSIYQEPGRGKVKVSTVNTEIFRWGGGGG